MKNHVLVGLSLCALLAVSNMPAQAGVIYNNWNYAIDSLNDGSGGSQYELRGLAMRYDGPNVYVAISGSFPQSGVPIGGVLNDKICLGDMFFNFSNHNLDDASKFTDPLVFGVRFIADNDSFGNTGSTPNNITGVFSTISTASLATANMGYGSLQSYVNSGFGRSVAAMGDLQDSTSASGDVVQYLSYNAQQTNMTSGTLLGGITTLDRSGLEALGLDFGHFPGADPVNNFVYGFSFSKSLLPSGDFTAHFFEECINDGVALKGSLSSVPEPASCIQAMLGLGIAGVASWRQFRRRRSD
jgi:hypothetical protein